MHQDQYSRDLAAEVVRLAPMEQKVESICEEDKQSITNALHYLVEDKKIGSWGVNLNKQRLRNKHMKYLKDQLFLTETLQWSEFFLNLSNNYFSDESIGDLVEILANPQFKIKKLDLSMNSFTKESAS